MSDTLKDMMDSTIGKIKSMVDVNSVIGDPIEVSDLAVIIPVSKISYGFGAGGSDFGGKSSLNSPYFGGGCGTGVTITPVCFLSVSKVSGNVTLLQVESFHGAVDRLVSMVPELFNKVSTSIKNKKQSKESS